MRYNIVEVITEQKSKDLMADIKKAASNVSRYASLDVLSKLSNLINNFEGNKFYALVKDETVCDVNTKNDIQAYGIAIDIGTTTVAAELINLLTGEQAARYSCINSQRIYGADVISRIQSANNGELKKMQSCITDDITEAIKNLIKSACIDKRNVYEAAIAGNTAMFHILLGIPVESIGMYPFKPTFTELLTFRYSEIFANDYIDCDVSILPSISAYVGADVTAGIVVSKMTDTFTFINKDNTNAKVLIDLGTNGEMAISYNGKIYCTSTAAGPALEGGNISCGTGGIPGAISKVKINKKTNQFETETIQNKYPIGICGSGVIDITAELKNNNIIDETGLIDEEALLCIQGKFHISKDIYFTQKDIREIQLAKSAVRAGLECILAEAAKDACKNGIELTTPYDLVDTLYIAGGFGFHINIKNASAIGLIPTELVSKVCLIGNSALAGAKLYLLDSEAQQKFISAAAGSIEINLSTDTNFNDLFIDYIAF